MYQLRRGQALFTRTGPIDKFEEAKRYCEENNLNLTYINRIKDSPMNIIPHEQFLELLKCFEYYLDLKGLTSLEVLSKSGLEALRAGCKVLVDTGEVVTDFQTTKPNEYVQLYFEILKS